MSASDRGLSERTSNRLLTRSEAAAYCAVSTTTFNRICEVRPIALIKNNPRLQRFDIRDIDAWIESKKELNDNIATSKDVVIDRLLK